MTSYILDDLAKYLPFSKRLERRAERVTEAAQVHIQLLNNNIFNAFNHWLDEYEAAVGANKHVEQNINVLQMKLEILYRSLVGRKFVKILKREPIHNTGANVINLFSPKTSDGFVDYRGKLEFQTLFADYASQYLAIDFCTEIYRDFMRSRGEYPFGEGDDVSQFAVRSAVSSLNYNSNQTFFRLMRFGDLPIWVPETAP